MTGLARLLLAAACAVTLLTAAGCGEDDALATAEPLPLAWPAQGTHLTGVVPVRVAPRAAPGRVELWVDGRVRAAGTTRSGLLQWNTRATPVGRHRITVRAAGAPAPGRREGILVRTVHRSPAPFPRRVVGLIGSDTDALDQERAAGVASYVVRVSWKDLEPTRGQVDEAYAQRVRARIDAMRATGAGIILDTGLQDAPAWVHDDDPGSWFVNQCGERWTGPTAVDEGTANLVWSASVRAEAVRYLDAAIALAGPGLQGVRIGGGRYNELAYPPATATCPNSYWAFDPGAAAENPVPGWRPGQPSPRGEAAAFYGWYAAALVDFASWQVQAVRRTYAGPVMELLPGSALRPGDVRAALAGNLSGTTVAERAGSVPRSVDWARQVRAVWDPLVLPTTTWLDAGYGDDASADPARWNPVHYLAALAAEHPSRPRLFGENTGSGRPDAMARTCAAARRYGLSGFVWFRQGALRQGTPDTLEDYRSRLAGCPR